MRTVLKTILDYKPPTEQLSTVRSRAPRFKRVRAKPPLTYATTIKAIATQTGQQLASYLKETKHYDPALEKLWVLGPAGPTPLESVDGAWKRARLVRAPRAVRAHALRAFTCAPDQDAAFPIPFKHRADAADEFEQWEQTHPALGGRADSASVLTTATADASSSSGFIHHKQPSRLTFYEPDAPTVQTFSKARSAMHVGKDARVRSFDALRAALHAVPIPSIPGAFRLPASNKWLVQVDAHKQPFMRALERCGALVSPLTPAECRAQYDVMLPTNAFIFPAPHSPPTTLNCDAAAQLLHKLASVHAAFHENECWIQQQLTQRDGAWILAHPLCVLERKRTHEYLLRKTWWMDVGSAARDAWDAFVHQLLPRHVTTRAAQHAAQIASTMFTADALYALFSRPANCQPEHAFKKTSIFI